MSKHYFAMTAGHTASPACGDERANHVNTDMHQVTCPKCRAWLLEHRKVSADRWVGPISFRWEDAA